MPQWDASQSDIEVKPFELDENGQWNFFKPNGEYFSRAQSMMEMAVERGFVPALVVLWCNYVPDTWACEPNVEVRSDISVIKMHDFNADALFIGIK